MVEDLVLIVRSSSMAEIISFWLFIFEFGLCTIEIHAVTKKLLLKSNSNKSFYLSVLGT
jgi:hypothetical protein